MAWATRSSTVGLRLVQRSVFSLTDGCRATLETLGSDTSWFFHDEDRDLDEWAREVTGRPAWATLRARTPAGISVYREQV